MRVTGQGQNWPIVWSETAPGIAKVHALAQIGLLWAGSRRIQGLGSGMGPVDGANRGLRFSRRPGNGELFMCFFYDNPGFVVTLSSRHEEVSAVMQEVVDRDVELWQISLPPIPDGIRHLTTRRLVF